MLKNKNKYLTGLFEQESVWKVHYEEVTEVFRTLNSTVERGMELRTDLFQNVIGIVKVECISLGIKKLQKYQHIYIM